MDTNIKVQEFSIPLWEYQNDGNVWSPKHDRPEYGMNHWESLQVVTYNIWFSGEHQPLRFKRLCDILNQSQAHVIGLQEVTKFVLENLLKQPFIRERYCVSDVNGRTFNDWYGVVLLIDNRLCVSNLSLIIFPESKMGRRLLMAEIKLDDNEMLRIGTVHLESLYNEEQRSSQLDICQKSLNRSPASCILMGDFNFSAAGKENIDQFQRLPQWIDVWPHLMGSDKDGFTYDRNRNSIAPSRKRIPDPCRSDRIALLSQTMIPSQIQIIGNQALDNDEHFNVFPSDHFGLIASFTRKNPF